MSNDIVFLEYVEYILQVTIAGVSIGVMRGVGEKVCLLIHLVYNGDMKADRNLLECVEKSELGWYVILCFYKMKETAQQSRC